MIDSGTMYTDSASFNNELTNPSSGACQRGQPPSAPVFAELFAATKRNIVPARVDLSQERIFSHKSSSTEVALGPCLSSEGEKPRTIFDVWLQPSCFRDTLPLRKRGLHYTTAKSGK
jgi:hypothetical protein